MNYDHSMEACVLSAMMLDETALIMAIEELEIAHFHRPQHQTLFTAMCQMFEKNITVDLATLINQLEQNQTLDYAGGTAHINEISDVVMSGANCKFHINILKEKKLTRDAVKICTNTLAQLERDEPIKQVIDSTREKLMNIDTSKEKHDFTAIEAVHTTMQKTEEAISSGKPVGLKTYIHDLDYFIIMKPGNLITIAAKKGIGKSMLANQIAFSNVLNDKKVVFFNMEMEVHEMINREIARKARIDLGNINFGKMDEKELAKYHYQTEVLADSYFVIDDNGLQTIPQIHSRIIKHKNILGGLDLVILDYFQLIKGGFGGSRQQQLGDLSRNLKIMAKHFGVPVVVMSQLNFDGMTREAEDLENDSDIVLKLFRPIADGTGTHEKDGVKMIKRDGQWIEPEENFSVLKITKNRGGKVGKIYLTFDGQHQQFNGWDGQL